MSRILENLTRNCPRGLILTDYILQQCKITEDRVWPTEATPGDMCRRTDTWFVCDRMQEFIFLHTKYCDWHREFTFAECITVWKRKYLIPGAVIPSVDIESYHVGLKTTNDDGWSTSELHPMCKYKLIGDFYHVIGV